MWQRTTKQKRKKKKGNYSGPIESLACRRRRRHNRSERLPTLNNHCASHAVTVLLSFVTWSRNADQPVQKQKHPENFADVPNERLTKADFAAANCLHSQTQDSFAHCSAPRNLQHKKVQHHQYAQRERKQNHV